MFPLFVTQEDETNNGRLGWAGLDHALGPRNCVISMSFPEHSRQIATKFGRRVVESRKRRSHHQDRSRAREESKDTICAGMMIPARPYARTPLFWPTPGRRGPPGRPTPTVPRARAADESRYDIY